MQQRKKQTGKGHTLYEDQIPKRPEDVWILVAESCYEISKTLLKEESCAASIGLYLSGYDHHADRGGLQMVPPYGTRYPKEIFSVLQGEPKVQGLIEKLLHQIRRIQVSVECEPYVVPLFYDLEDLTRQFEMLERIRGKFGIDDVIGLGLEGLRYQRIKTYTPKRMREIQRAKLLLSAQRHLWDVILQKGRI